MFYHLLVRKRVLVSLTLCCVLTSLIFLGNWTAIYYYLHPKDGIGCYLFQEAHLEEVGLSPPKDRSIFFHETSCRSHFDGRVTITPRQACAVESAAKLNPNFQVFLLLASPGVVKEDGDSEEQRVLRVLKTYPNFNLLYLNFGRYVKNSPVEDLYFNGKIANSDYAQSHASDVLRYLTLWKFGGIYLDLDVIVIKSLEGLPFNYAGAESENNVAAGVMSFSSQGLGHDLAQDCLLDLKHNFNGKDWGYNGPGVITRLSRKLCEVTLAKDMVTKPSCKGFKVHNTSAFYALPWWNWTMYFDPSAQQEVEKLSEQSYIIHVWNKLSISTKLPLNSNASYARFARQFCPKTFSQLSVEF